MPGNLFTSTIEKLFADGVCIACRSQSPEVLCSSCLRRFEALEGCARCGSPRCMGLACNRRWLPYKRCQSAVAYSGPAKDLVLAMKRGGRPASFRLAACEMLRRLDLYVLGGLSVVTWVPAGSGGRDRGFDQGRELAFAVAGALGIDAAPMLLRIGMDRQHTLGRVARLEADVFRARRGLRVARSSILLVDDVTTSGASLFYAALALREAGLANVEAATFARTPLLGTVRSPYQGKS